MITKAVQIHWGFCRANAGDLVGAAATATRCIWTRAGDMIQPHKCLALKGRWNVSAYRGTHETNFSRD